MAFRVLSLDGGGVWSLVQALALARIYTLETTGRTVLRDFDMVAATSGGSIVLGGLVEDLPLGVVLGIFKNPESLGKLFSRTNEFLGPLLHMLFDLGPRYDTKMKLETLRMLAPKYGARTLAEAAAGVRRPGRDRDVHLLITAFDYDRRRAQFFRSAPAGGRAWGNGEASRDTLAEAIHASTNPPVLFFDKPAELGPRRFWDGAITGYNNPVLAAVAEATVLTDGSEEIIALSIGAGTVMRAGPAADHPTSSFIEAKERPCIVSDIRKVASSIIDDPPDAATFLAHVMTGGIRGLNWPLESRIVRINPLVRPIRIDGVWTAPGSWTPKAFDALAGLSIDSTKPKQVEAIYDYAQLWLADQAPNQPIRMSGDFERELGHERFSDALAAWRQLTAAETQPYRP